MKTYIQESDDLQRELIRSEINKNMFVEAGAGAGKTFAIVGRLMEQFKAGKEPERIVIITFTNAAAEELRKRITEETVKRTQRPENDEMRLDRSFLEKLDLMNISTIHSFCNTLLMEKCFDAELPIGATLLLPEEEHHVEEHFFERWLAQLGADVWKILLEAGGKDTDKTSVKKAVKAMYFSFLEAGEDIDIVLDSYDENAVRKAMCTDYMSVLSQLITIFEECKDQLHDIVFAQEGKGSEKLQEEYLVTIDSMEKGAAFWLLLEEYQQLKDIDDGAEKWSQVEGLYERALKLLPAKSKPWFKATTHAKEVNAKIVELNEKSVSETEVISKQTKKELGDKRKDLSSDASKDRKYRTYASYAKKAVLAYRKQRDAGELTNNLLLYKTRELLMIQKVREFYADKYDCFYVDEFQDTDHLQAEFIWALAATKESLTELRDGALFVVGDPKQSIYRFRGAEPEVFFDIKSRMEHLKNAEVFFLSKNYRSNEKIVGWVDRYFSKIDLVSQGEYRNMEPVNCLPESAWTNVLSGFYKLTTYSDEFNAEADAKALVQVIQTLVNGKYEIYDPSKKDKRPIKKKDFLVLCDAIKGMDEYMNALLEAKIPVQVMGELQVDREYAVKAYIRLFAAIAGKCDKAKNMAAVEALRFSGLIVPCEEDRVSKEAQIVRYMEEVIKRMREKTKDLTPFAKAEYLLRHLEWFIRKEEEQDVFRVVIIQSRIQQMLECCADMEFESADSLARAFLLFAEKKIDRELPLEEDADAVRFMNFHKAKGLEGNIVIWTKRNTNRHSEYSPYKKDGKYYPAYKDGKWKSYYNDSKIVEEVAIEEERENHRYEYVIATRAKQAFIFMEELDGKEGVLFQGITNGGEHFETTPDLSALVEVEEQELEQGKDTAALKEKGCEVYQIKECRKEPEECADGKSQAVEVKRCISPSEFEKKGATKSMLKINSDMERKEEEQESEVSDVGNRPTGNIVGNILHRAFELVINRGCLKSGFELADDVITWCVDQAFYENEMDIKLSQEEMEAFDAKQYMQELDKKKKRYKVFASVCVTEGMRYMTDKNIFECKKEILPELQFSYYSKEADMEVPTIINGFMDLLLLDKEGKALIIDYKSDEAENYDDDEMKQALTIKYSPQIERYKEAVHQLYGIEKEDIQAKLIYFRQYDEITQSVKVCEIMIE